MTMTMTFFSIIMALLLTLLCFVRVLRWMHGLDECQKEADQRCLDGSVQ